MSLHSIKLIKTEIPLLSGTPLPSETPLLSEAPLFAENGTSEKDFICYVCLRSFSRIGFLKAHFQRTHPNTPFPASLLPSKPPPVPHARKVTAIFTQKKDTSYPCDKCSKTFTKKIELLKHAFLHRKYAITFYENPIHVSKTFVCHNCNTMFAGLRAFTVHAERCPLCIRWNCKVQTESKKLCKDGTECRVCKINLCISCHNLHLELDAVQKEKKSFECVVCQEGFSTKMDLKDHYANFHAISKLAY